MRTVIKEVVVFASMFALAFYIDVSPIDLDSMHKDTIHVLVKGEVEEEVDVPLNPYATIEEALSAVTLTEDADLDCLNPRTIVNDGDVIVVPSKQEDSIRKVSINSASEEEFVLVPGIGPSTAKRIVEYRNEVGLFQKLEDLLDVKGIGPNKFEKMKEYLTL